MSVGETYTAARKTVDIRRVNCRISVSAHVTIAEVVGNDYNHVRPLQRLLSGSSDSRKSR
jgi:hypothetical protein